MLHRWEISAEEAFCQLVEGWLEDIRTASTITTSLEEGYRLAQIWQRGDTRNIAAALDAWLTEQCEQLGEAMADLLIAYYWQAQSVQAIKNNHRRPESVATLWRRVKEAREQLIDALYAAEQVARDDWQRKLYGRLPAQLETNLFGRSHTITTLTNSITTPNQHIFNLIGVGGLGKTALTHATVRHLIDGWYVRDVVWIDVEQTEITTAQLLDQITGRLYLHLTGVSPAAVEHKQRVHHLQPLLQQRPLLLVVDNIEQICDDDGTLSAELTLLINPSRILLVSRTAIVADSPIRALPLSELTLEATTAFVRDRATKLGITPPSEDIFAPLYRVIGGHPLALRLFVQLGRYFAAAEIIAEFESADVRDIDTLYSDIFTRIYAQQETTAHQLLDALLLVPPSGADRDYLAAFCGLAKGPQWEAIRALADAALLERIPDSQPPRYRVHSLTAAYLNSRPTPRDWQAAQRQAAIAYWQAQTEGADTTFLTTHNAALTHLARVGLGHADSWVATAELMLALYFPLHNSYHWGDWLPLFQRALDHADDERRDLQYRLYSRLATLHHRVDYEKAAEMHHHAITLAQSLNDLKGVGREHAHLSAVYSNLHCHKFAEQHGKTALDIFEELNLHPHFRIAALNSLGVNAYEQTDFVSAISYFRKAIEIGQGKVAKDVIASVYANWGNALRLSGKGKLAFEKYQTAKRLSEENSLSAILLNYGLCNLHLDHGSISDADEIISASFAVHELNGLPSWFAAHISETLGRYHLLANEPTLAIQHLEKAAIYWRNAQGNNNYFLTLALLISSYSLNSRAEQVSQLNTQVAELLQRDNLTAWYTIYSDVYQLPDFSAIQSR